MYYVNLKWSVGGLIPLKKWLTSGIRAQMNGLIIKDLDCRDNSNFICLEQLALEQELIKDLIVIFHYGFWFSCLMNFSNCNFLFVHLTGLMHYWHDL